jgi:hypothetical protein
LIMFAGDATPAVRGQHAVSPALIHAAQDQTPFIGGVIAPTQIVTPNDDLYERYQWNLRRIQAGEGWRLTTGSASVIVAVLDTGVSLTHPELARRIVAGYDFVNEDANPEDDHGNGTHIAGVIAAEANNRTGITGLAWQSRIMPVKVLDSMARGDPDVAAQGVTWATDHGAKVINLGLAGRVVSTRLDEAIEYAVGRGVVVVAPMGSDGDAEPSYPAANPKVIAVGATDRLDQRLATSNVGAYMSVSAPGEQIASTFRGPGGPDTYAVAGTTAQAAAHASGLVALMLALNPSLTPAEVRALIESSADDIGPPGRDRETGAGRINVYRALLMSAPWHSGAAGAASYSAPDLATNTAYFPLVLKDNHGWNTVLTIQNTAPRNATFALSLVDETGAQAEKLTATIAPMGAASLVLARLASVPNGFVGSAIVQADAPIAGVVNLDRPGRDRLSYVGLPAGTTMVWVPLLMREANGWDTGFQIQNLTQSTVHARVSFFTQGEATPVSVSVVQLAPLAPLAIYQPSDHRLPREWVGSALIESLENQPLAVVVNQLSDDGLGMAYVGIGAPSETLRLPLVYKNAGDWSSGVQVQNAGTAPTTVTLSYFRADGSSPLATDRASIPPGAAVTFYQGTSHELPDGFAGPATVTSLDGQPLVAVVNAVKQGSGMATAYDAVAIGGPALHLPLLYREFGGWSSGVQLQNVGNASAVVNLTFYQEDGREVATTTRSLERGAVTTVYLPELAELPSAFIGSAIATSQNGEPIAAMVNQVK